MIVFYFWVIPHDRAVLWTSSSRKPNQKKNNFDAHWVQTDTGKFAKLHVHLPTPKIITPT